MTNIIVRYRLFLSIFNVCILKQKSFAGVYSYSKRHGRKHS